MFEFIKRFSFIIKERSEFEVDKFNRNNIRILILSLFLVFEQIYYGVFVRLAGSLVQRIHFISAVIMLFFAISSIYFQINKPNSISLGHKIYQNSMGICGLMIAVIRAAVANYQVFSLPTIYIAVLYGMAVIFYYDYKESFIMYFSATIFLIFMLPLFQSSLQDSLYMPDAISNGLIAWIISMINYHNYVVEFLDNKVIEKKNKELIEKNKEIVKINKQLEEMTIKDGLTDIYNRRKLDEELESFYCQAKRYDKVFSLILLDLDHFKDINDNFGHVIGDKVLIKFSKLLKDNIREVDICGRWGGEEFLVICPETNLKETQNLAQRLKEMIDGNNFIEVGKVTSSFGVASYKVNDDIESVIKRVDDCLYKAKESGRDIVVCEREL